MEKLFQKPGASSIEQLQKQGAAAIKEKERKGKKPQQPSITQLFWVDRKLSLK